MTSETLEGFTSYGRPVLAMRITEITDLPDGEMCEVTVEPMPASDPPHRSDDVYALIGANLQTVAENLKTHAFARSAALRWSRMLGEPVALYRQGAVEIDGSPYDALAFDTLVNAHEMSDDEFAAEMLAAERGRLVNVVDALRETEMDVRATREDAESALEAIDTFGGLDDVPPMAVAEVARAAAEVYETIEWYTIIKSDDEDMLAELSAAQ